MKVRRRLLGLVLLVAMIGALLVAATGSGIANPVTTQAGQIDLSLSNNSGSWTLDQGPNGSVDATQTLGKSGQCTLTSSGASIITMTASSTAGSGPYVGIRSGAIGVKDSSEGNGEPCARIDAAQSLTLGLGSAVTSRGLIGSAAQLALRFKYNATATIDLKREGVLVRSVVFACTGGSDCGPDSGSSDVGIVSVPEGDVFDTIVIRSTGAVSLVDDLAGTHIHLAADEVTVSGTKFHDRDTDGVQDATSDEPLSGWTIKAYQGGVEKGTAVTDANGAYSMTLPVGSYVICEELKTDTPPFGWSQVKLNATLYPTYQTGACSGLGASAPDGHVLALTQNTGDIDFGNVRQAFFDCNGSPHTANIPQAGNLPGSSLTVTCNKAGGLATAFDVGTAPDEGYNQFVTVGLDAFGTEVQEQTIFWAEEPAVYNANNVLQVATTKVVLAVGGTPQPVVFCGLHPLDTDGNPSTGSNVAHCLESQSIALGGTVSPGKMKLTEQYAYLGDPFNFR